jgi:dihydroorotate dehydrogenase (fumarate)
MANTAATYMGVELKNPVLAGASSLTSNVSGIKKAAENGAGGIVISSLFEEQIQAESFLLDEELTQNDNLHAEMTSIFPDVSHGGPDKHLMIVREAKKAVDVPVFASLNAVTPEAWVTYAEQLAETGVDGLELNFYSTPTSFTQSGADAEQEQLAVLASVREKVDIPISIKVSPYYSNVLDFIKKADDIGVNGFVLFNRFFQPDIDIDKEANVIHHNLSTRGDSKLPLRFAGMLYGNIKGDVCSSSGIMSGQDVVKLLLAGASCVQVVSTLFKNKVSYLAAMVKELEGWMSGKGYTGIDDFRGKLSAQNNPDPWVYKRAQYVRLLLKPDWMG